MTTRCPRKPPQLASTDDRVRRVLAILRCAVLTWHTGTTTAARVHRQPNTNIAMASPVPECKPPRGSVDGKTKWASWVFLFEKPLANHSGVRIRLALCKLLAGALSLCQAFSWCLVGKRPSNLHTLMHRAYMPFIHWKWKRANCMRVRARSKRSPTVAWWLVDLHLFWETRVRPLLDTPHVG